MPFNWRRFIPYGLGSLIPNPATPAPAPPSGGSAPTGWQQYSGNPAPAALSYTGNWGQTGSANAPDAGMSAFGSSTGPNVYTPNAAPSRNPLAVSGEATSINPFSMPFQQGPDSIWGNAAATPGTAAVPVNSNPGAGPLAVDLGPQGKVSNLSGYAK